jgi:hypothetical protein
MALGWFYKDQITVPLNSLVTAIDRGLLMTGSLALRDMSAKGQSQAAPLQAPVGHRQPTTKDLPADVLQNEQRATPSDKRGDKRSTICKGC